MAARAGTCDLKSGPSQPGRQSGPRDYAWKSARDRSFV